MIRGVIFDMDGIILDSMPFFYNSFNKLFEERYNVSVSKDLFASFVGKKAEHGIELILQKNNIDGDINELRKKWEDIVYVGQDKIKLMPGIKAVLENLSDYKLAVATGNIERFTNNILQRHNLLKYFDVIMTGDHVDHAKPDPEIFLKAADELQLSPNECVVIEDAELGIMAAKMGGMWAISIPNEFTKEQDHSEADLTLNSVSELNKEVIENIR